MNSVFADTFYWIALTSPRDAARRTALEVSRQYPNRVIVTTDEVLSEFLTFYASESNSRIRAAGFVAAMLATGEVKVVPQSRDSFLAGLELYRTRPDKGYSLTDCISMQTMRRMGISEILTNDKHFQQEGFTSLFRD